MLMACVNRQAQSCPLVIGSLSTDLIPDLIPSYFLYPLVSGLFVHDSVHTSVGLGLKRQPELLSVNHIFIVHAEGFNKYTRPYKNWGFVQVCSSSPKNTTKRCSHRRPAILAQPSLAQSILTMSSADSCLCIVSQENMMQRVNTDFQSSRVGEMRMQQSLWNNLCFAPGGTLKEQTSAMTKILKYPTPMSSESGCS